MQERLALGLKPGPLHFKFRCLPARPKSISCGYSSAKFDAYSEKRGKNLGGGGGGGWWAKRNIHAVSDYMCRYMYP